jgi:hypothetical protein
MARAKGRATSALRPAAQHNITIKQRMRFSLDMVLLRFLDVTDSLAPIALARLST